MIRKKNETLSICFYHSSQAIKLGGCLPLNHKDEYGGLYYPSGCKNTGGVVNMDIYTLAAVATIASAIITFVSFIKSNKKIKIRLLLIGGFCE
jgi:hypothetical protein